MSVQIKELNDGRNIGCSVFEVVSFPSIDSYEGDRYTNLEQTHRFFLNTVIEFNKLGQNSNTIIELLWLTEKADKQIFRSKIRIFCAVRKIGAYKEILSEELEELINNIMMSLSSKQYRVELYNDSLSEISKMLDNINKECIYSIIKTEKCAGNSASVYPYYYTDVIPADNIDNFDSIILSLSQYEDCCLSFQLFPTQFTVQELIYLNEVTGELGKLSDGILIQNQMYRDTTAAEPYKVLSYYQTYSSSSLFLYNILIFGKRVDCSNLATKIISLLNSGKKELIKSNFGCLDLTAEKINLASQFIFYPWNINNKLIYTYRNKQLLQTIPMAKTLFRLPYIITADEAASFFRLPLRDKSMTALKGNQAVFNVEQFDDSVVSENNIIFGTLISNDGSNIIIGCPEKSFTKHALIVGTPGSGKTTFSFNILLQFAKRQIPFFAIEPTKAEYRAMIDAIPDIQIFTPGNNSVAPYIFNPFIPPKGISIEQYIPSLANAFKAAFSMPSPLDIIFLRAIRMCYSENGWKDYSKYGDTDVTVFGLHEFILTFKRLINESNYSGEIKGNLQSAGVFRLMNLLEQNSNIFDSIHTVPIEDILGKPTILELNSIDNTEQKALIMALLLINICVYTKHNHIGDGVLKNIILIDEAHVLLGVNKSSDLDSADSQSATIKALQDMIAEIRSYGTGIIIADQSPSKVSREVVANTDIKVSFRLVQSSEKILIADSTNMDDSTAQQLSRLKPGEAFMYFSRLETPQLILTEDIREKEGIRLSVSNEEISERMTYWLTRQKMLMPFVECTYCTTCKDGCDFILRAKASYFANKLYSLYSKKITDEDKLKQYLASVEKLLGSSINDLDDISRKSIIKCTAIRFIRKVQLETSILVNKSDIKKIILMVGENDG